MKSKIISISAIAAGFTAIVLLFGAYVEAIDLFSIVLSSVFVVLPLYYGSYKGSFLAYLAGGIIAFLCSGFNVLSLVFPAYFVFFGIYPIVKSKMHEVNMNRCVRIILGLLWMLISVYGIYFYYVNIMHGIVEGLPEWFVDNVLYFVGAIGVIFFFIYDRFLIVVRIFINRYLSKIIK